MHRLEIGKRSFDLPGDWNEMTSDQLCFLSVVLTGKCSVQEVKVKMFLYCLNARVCSVHGLTSRVNVPGVGRVSIDPEEMVYLSGVFDFLFDGNDLTFGLWRNPFPVFKQKRLVLYGPDDGLTNISYGQFIMLQSWQQRLKDDPEVFLSKFLSVIWKKDAFSLSEDGDSEVFKRVPMEVKQVMYWYYLGSLRMMQGRFPRVFPSGMSGGSGGDEVFDVQQQIVDEMAGGDVTKKESVKRSLLWDALYTMDMAIEKSEKRRSV